MKTLKKIKIFKYYLKNQYNKIFMVVAEFLPFLKMIRAKRLSKKYIKKANALWEMTGQMQHVIKTGPYDFVIMDKFSMIRYNKTAKKLGMTKMDFLKLNSKEIYRTPLGSTKQRIIKK